MFALKEKSVSEPEKLGYHILSRHRLRVGMRTV
jgi:hypothetical protein